MQVEECDDRGGAIHLIAQTLTTVSYPLTSLAVNGRERRRALGSLLRGERRRALRSAPRSALGAGSRLNGFFF